MSHSWSVVITTRNRASMLKRGIESCFRQTLPCEIVVVDEASTDDTPLVIQSFPNITYIRNDRALGHSAAANIGIRAASGQWIKPLDDDDWLDPSCIEAMDQCVSAAEKAGCRPVIVSGPAVVVNEEGREIRRISPFASTPVAVRSDDLLKLMMTDSADLGTPLQVGHQREAALAAKGWVEDRKFGNQQGDEVELWIKLAGCGDAVFMSSPVGFSTVWPGGVSRRYDPEFSYRVNVYLKELIADELGEYLSSRMQSYLAFHWALVAVKRKMFRQAIRLAMSGMKRPDSILGVFHRSRNTTGTAVPLDLGTG